MMILGEAWDEYEGLGQTQDPWDPFEGVEEDYPEEGYWKTHG